MGESQAFSRNMHCCTIAGLECAHVDTSTDFVVDDTLLIITGVDYCKNLLITWIGVAMQQCCSHDCLRLIAMGMVGMIFGAGFCNIAVTGWELPPPVLVYILVTAPIYIMALMNETPKKRKKM